MKITRSDSEKLVVADFPATGILYLLLALAGVGLCLRQDFHHTWPPKDWMSQCFVIGLFFVLGSIITKRSVFTFDRMRREVAWSRVGLFTRKNGTFPFSDILDVSVESMISSKGRPSWRVALTRREGVLPLTGSYGGFTGRGPYDRVRDEIKVVLGLPLNELHEDDLRMLVRTGATLAAIELARTRYGCSLAEAKKIVEGLR